MDLTVSPYNTTNFKPVFNAKSAHGIKVLPNIHGIKKWFQAPTNYKVADAIQALVKFPIVCDTASSTEDSSITLGKKIIDLDKKIQAKISEDQKMVTTFKTGNKDEIFQIIDDKGVEYVNELIQRNDGTFYSYNGLAFIYNSKDVIECLIDKLGLDVLLAREGDYNNAIEMACMSNNDPETIELIYDRVIAEKGIQYINEKNEENGFLSLVDNTFTCNSAKVLEQLIKKYGKIFFLTSKEHYANPVELACCYNPDPNAVWLMCTEFQGYDRYFRTDASPAKTNIECVYARNSKGTETLVENPIFLCRDGSVDPLAKVFEMHENPDVIKYVYNQLNNDKDCQDICVELAFEHNFHSEVIKRLIEILGKDAVTERKQYEDGSIGDSYLDKAFDCNIKDEVIGMLIDTFGVETLMKGPKSTLEQYFRHHGKMYGRKATTSKVVEKLGPIVIGSKRVYPLNMSKFPWFDKLFKEIISE